MLAGSSRFAVLAFGGPNGNSWQQVGYLFAALVLAGAIGFERELRHKSVGLRTNAVIGVAAALVMEVSKFGFDDVLGNHVTLDLVVNFRTTRPASATAAVEVCFSGRCEVLSVRSESANGETRVVMSVSATDVQWLFPTLSAIPGLRSLSIADEHESSESRAS